MWAHMFAHMLPIAGYSNKYAKWLQRRLAARWAWYLLTILTPQLQGPRRVAFTQEVESDDWIHLLTYRNQKTQRHHVREVNMKEFILHHFLDKKPEYLDATAFYCRSVDGAGKFDFIDYPTRTRIQAHFLGRQGPRPQEEEEDGAEPPAQEAPMQAAAARAALDDPQPSREQMDSTVLCSSRGRADPEEHDPRTVQEADLHRGGVDDPGPGQLPRLPGRPRAQTLTRPLWRLCV